MGTRARRQEHGRRPHRPHRPPRTAHQIRGPLLPKRTRPHDQITNTTQTGSGRYRTPCGKPAAYTAEKHRSQSGRQLAKTHGDSYDNAMAESVNGAYKTELVWRRKPFHDLKDLELATFRWVSWWNSKRPHRSLGYRTPEAVETEYYTNQAAQAASL